MSRAKPKEQRRANEAYPTPAWALRRLLDEIPLRGGRWWEPAVGTGILCATAKAHPRGHRTHWWGSDIHYNAQAHQALGDARYAVHDTLTVRQGLFPDTWEDFRDTDLREGRPFTGYLTNPPFSLAEEFLQIGLHVAEEVILLLPLKWLESRKRTFLNNNFPDVYVLPDRVSFTGEGTDVTAYAWMRWVAETPRPSGRIMRLGLTDAAERKADAPRPSKDAAGKEESDAPADR